MQARRRLFMRFPIQGHSARRGSILAVASAVALAGLLGGTDARADSATWNGGTPAVDGTWANIANWTTGIATVPGTGDTATFNNAGGGFTTIDLGGGITINTILF